MPSERLRCEALGLCPPRPPSKQLVIESKHNSSPACLRPRIAGAESTPIGAVVPCSKRQHRSNLLARALAQPPLQPTPASVQRRRASPRLQGASSFRNTQTQRRQPPRMREALRSHETGRP
eukprot:scaffold3953_cov236-Pinguiococcus_pyrenoidosus.AAC.9